MVGLSAQLPRRALRFHANQRFGHSSRAFGLEEEVIFVVTFARGNERLIEAQLVDMFSRLRIAPQP